MRSALRSGLAGALLLVALGLGGASGADEIPLRGYGLVAAKDMEARSVTVNGATYRVDQYTVLLDADGGWTTLEEIRAAEPGATGLDPRVVDGVYFRAEERGGQVVLEKLKVMHRLPH